MAWYNPFSLDYDNRVDPAKRNFLIGAASTGAVLALGGLEKAVAQMNVVTVQEQVADRDIYYVFYPKGKEKDVFAVAKIAKGVKYALDDSSVDKKEVQYDVALPLFKSFERHQISDDYLSPKAEVVLHRNQGKGAELSYSSGLKKYSITLSNPSDPQSSGSGGGGGGGSSGGGGQGGSSG